MYVVNTDYFYIW